MILSLLVSTCQSIFLIGKLVQIESEHILILGERSKLILYLIHLASMNIPSPCRSSKKGPMILNLLVSTCQSIILIGKLVQIESEHILILGERSKLILYLIRLASSKKHSNTLPVTQKGSNDSQSPCEHLSVNNLDRKIGPDRT